LTTLLVVIIIPALINAREGENAEFNCSVVGIDITDLEYQWFLNQLPISGQNTSTLTINDVTYANSGDYACIIRNPYKEIARSEVARLLILGMYILLYHTLFNLILF